MNEISDQQIKEYKKNQNKYKWFSRKLSKREAQESSLKDEKDELGATRNPVSVKVLKINQKESEFSLKLLDYLRKIPAEDFDELMETKFVKAMFFSKWNYYQSKIISWYFLPYVFYMTSMLCFLWFTLLEDISERNINGCAFHAVYYPLFCCCLGFSLKQILSEIKQRKTHDTFYDYLSIWNLVDVTYITLNIIIMLMNFADVMRLEFGDPEGGISLLSLSWFVVDREKGSLSIQRKLAAFSTLLLWFRFYDWLKLFKQTAFYLVLIKNTIYYSRDFILIILTSLMGFGSVVYFLNIDKLPEDEMMTNRYGIMFLDIFQNQYE